MQEQLFKDQLPIIKLQPGPFPLDQKLLALSWKQPFASAMLCGKIETRTWNANVRGWVMICTSKKAYGEDIEHKLCGTDLYLKMMLALKNEADTLDMDGYGIAIGRLVGSRKMKPEDAEKCFVRYREDLFCHVYEDVVKIKPIPWRGTQGWKEVKEDIKRTIEIL